MAVPRRQSEIIPLKLRGHTSRSLLFCWIAFFKPRVNLLAAVTTSRHVRVRLRVDRFLPTEKSIKFSIASASKRSVSADPIPHHKLHAPLSLDARSSVSHPRYSGSSQERLYVIISASWILSLCIACNYFSSVKYTCPLEPEIIECLVTQISPSRRVDGSCTVSWCLGFAVFCFWR